MANANLHVHVEQFSPGLALIMKKRNIYPIKNTRRTVVVSNRSKLTQVGKGFVPKDCMCRHENNLHSQCP